MTASVEIERKFLVSAKPDRPADEFHKIRQGYIARENGNTVRIREKNGEYILCIKTSNKGFSRNELEYEVSKEEADILFASLKHPPIEKTREIYNYGDLVWEVDIFEGENKGLIVAEVELKSENQQVDVPDWVGPEVTGLSKFYNANLAYGPFSGWGLNYQGLLDRLSD